jgi:glycine hydroxymethyltransferase
VNRNVVPSDPRPPLVTSGLRIGTAALATRGFHEADFEAVADVIVEALAAPADLKTRAVLRDRVTALAGKYPLYSFTDDESPIHTVAD